jgi:hypothetical protein
LLSTISTSAIEEEDDDGQYAQTKEEYIEDLKELEQAGASCCLVSCVNIDVLHITNFS